MKRLPAPATGRRASPSPWRDPQRGARRALLPVVLAASLASWSCGAHAQRIAEAMRDAFAHDPLYAAALAGARGAQAKGEQARALWRPQASVSLGGGVGGAGTTMSGASFSAPGFPDTTGAAFRTRIDSGPYMRWVLAAQQPIYSRERTASERQLQAQAQLGQVRLELAAQDLRLRVVQAYVGTLSAEDAVTSLERQRDALARALDEAKERYDAGDAPVTELREAQSRRDGIAAQLLGAQAQLRLRRGELEDVTGRPVSSLARPRVPGTVPGALEAWLQRALDASPMRRMFDLAESIARDEAAKLEGWTSPSVDLVARASDDRLRGDGPYGDARATSSAYAVGVQVNVPLYTGGMRDAQRSESLAMLERTRAENEDGRRTVRRQVRDAWEGMATGAARIAALEQARASAATRLDATQVGREAGARTTLDVLNAQAELFAAERALLQARHALVIDRVRLAAAAGELDDATIDLLEDRSAR